MSSWPLLPEEVTVEAEALIYRGRAPIASMDAMEDVDLLSGSNTHLNKLSTEITAAAMTAKQPFGVKYRNVGKTGLKISNVGLGSMKLFSLDKPEVAEEVVNLAFESGINFFDVSDPNQQERSEREFGRIFAKKGWNRKHYNICTRIHWSRPDERSCLSRKEIIESVKQSLKNLQLEYIDLVLIHKADPNCPLEEIVRAMTYCINAGMIMYWGTSRWTTVEICEAHSIAKTLQCLGPICEMAEYHWFHREKVELYMAELYNRVGFGLLTWSPISYGLSLGGSYEEMQQLMLKLCMKNCKQNKTAESVSDTTESLNRLKLLNSLAEKNGCSLNQLLIAWCIRNQTSQCVIASAATQEQLMTILGSLAVVKQLTFSTCEEIDRILGNKPSRPPMISTLQQRWATTGGVPPC